MEDPQSEISPLAAFPNEHPTPSPVIKPIHKSKQLLIGIFVVVLCILASYGGYMYLSSKKAIPVEKQITQRISPTAIPTPKVVIANATVYTNPTYSYQITYDKTTAIKTADTEKFADTEFTNGCMKIYVADSNTIATIPVQKNDIPWDQINDLKTLGVGQTKNCSVLTFTFAPDGHAIVNKNDYKRLADTTISHQNWYAYEVKNGGDSPAHHVYFTERSGKTYLIEEKTGGSCPATLSSDMLTTFSFTK